MGKWFSALLLLVSLLLPFDSVWAASTQPSPPSPTSPDILVTSIAADGGTLNILEIYSQANAPIDLTDWSFSFVVKDTAACSLGDEVEVMFPSGWMLPKRYLTFTNGGEPGKSVPFEISPAFASGCTQPWISEISLFKSGQLVQLIELSATDILPPKDLLRHRQRDYSINSKRTLTGIFNDDYKQNTNDVVLYSDPLYHPPATSSGLKILEILPHSRDCSPLETDMTCGDYVKLHNPTNQPINLAMYRLRAGYSGQNTSVTNTFTWGQELDSTNEELILDPGKYITLATRNDGQLLSLTDSGGFIWLEDAYGAKAYSPVVEYPSASSVTKVGWTWAFDGAVWRWTSRPRPSGPNSFSAATPEVIGLAESALGSCPAGKFRNPLTNRCKSITSSTSSLTPCKPGQSRNSSTNRCRSSASSTSSLKPCKPGQERNPKTNRCRSTLAASSSLKPCDEGEERNPDTNRCRKVAASLSGADPEDKQSDKKSMVNYALLGLVGSSALGYGAYEYRNDFRNKLYALKSRYFPGNTGK